VGTEQTFEKLEVTFTMVRRSDSIESVQDISCFFFYSVIFTQKLNIIRKKEVICLQIFSVLILQNIIKNGSKFG